VSVPTHRVAAVEGNTAALAAGGDANDHGMTCSMLSRWMYAMPGVPASLPRQLIGLYAGRRVVCTLAARRNPVLGVRECPQHHLSRRVLTLRSTWDQARWTVAAEVSSSVAGRLMRDSASPDFDKMPCTSRWLVDMLQHQLVSDGSSRYQFKNDHSSPPSPPATSTPQQRGYGICS